MSQFAGGDIIYTISGDASPLEKSIAGGEKHAQAMGANFAKISKQIGAGFTVAGGVITAAMGVSVKSATDFGTAMAEVSTLGVKDLKGLGDTVKNIASTYGLELTPSVKGLYQAISAGVSEMQAPLVLEEAAKAASAGVSDLATAIELGTSVTNAFGLEMENISGVYDLSFGAVRNGVTTLDELAASVGKVAPIMAAAGLGADEMFASIGALTKGGIATSEAVSGLKAALSNIIKPSAEAAELAGSLGLNFNAAALESQGLAGFLEAVQQATGGNVETMSKLFGSVEGLNVVLALAGEQSESFNAMLTDMRENTGQTQRAFEELQKNDPSQPFKQLMATIEGLRVEIGEALLPVLSRMVEIAKGVLGEVKGWISGNEELFATITLITAGVGAAMVALGPFLIALPTIAAGLAAILSPAGAVALAVGGALVGAFLIFKDEAVAAFHWVRDNWDHFVTLFRESWETLKGVLSVGKELFQAVFAVIGDLVGGFADGLAYAMGWASKETESGMGSVASSFEEGSDSVQESLKKITESLQWFRGYYKENIARIVEYTGWAVGVVSGLWEMLSAIATGGTLGVSGAIGQRIGNWFADMLWGGNSEAPEGFSRGGRVSRGKRITVGELGPELFVRQDVRNGPPVILGKNGPETGRIPENGYIFTAAQTRALGIGLRDKPLKTYEPGYQKLVTGALSKLGEMLGFDPRPFTARERLFHAEMKKEYADARIGTGGNITMVDVPMRERGGPVRAGQPYIVGEREPEIFVPRQDGAVLNQQQMAGMGGFSFNPTVNISVGGGAGGVDADAIARAVDRKLYDFAAMANRRMGSPVLSMG